MIKKEDTLNSAALPSRAAIKLIFMVGIFGFIIVSKIFDTSKIFSGFTIIPFIVIFILVVIMVVKKMPTGTLENKSNPFDRILEEIKVGQEYNEQPEEDKNQEIYAKSDESIVSSSTLSSSNKSYYKRRSQGKKKYWFKPKKFGYGYQPCSREGWLITILGIVTIMSMPALFWKELESGQIPVVYITSVVGIILLLIYVSYKKSDPSARKSFIKNSRRKLKSRNRRESFGSTKHRKR